MNLYSVDIYRDYDLVASCFVVAEDVESLYEYLLSKYPRHIYFASVVCKDIKTLQIDCIPDDIAFEHMDKDDSYGLFR